MTPLPGSRLNFFVNLIDEKWHRVVLICIALIIDDVKVFGLFFS